MKNKHQNYRKETITSLIPKDVKKVLDIGSANNVFKDFKVTTLDETDDANISQDLNIDQKLQFKDNSFDLVVLNQILEHLTYVEEIVEESKRVSSKYIFVGLPNELVYSLRLKFLFGKIEMPGYMRYGHKHRYGIKEAEEFVKNFYGDYEKKVYYGAFTGAKFLPVFFVSFLAKTLPKLFAKEVYYLIKLDKKQNDKNKK